MSPRKRRESKKTRKYLDPQEALQFNEYAHKDGITVTDLAGMFDITAQTVRQKLYNLGLATNRGLVYDPKAPVSVDQQPAEVQALMMHRYVEFGRKLELLIREGLELGLEIRVQPVIAAKAKAPA